MPDIAVETWYHATHMSHEVKRKLTRREIFFTLVCILEWRKNEILLAHYFVVFELCGRCEKCCFLLQLHGTVALLPSYTCWNLCGFSFECNEKLCVLAFFFFLCFFFFENEMDLESVFHVGVGCGFFVWFFFHIGMLWSDKDTLSTHELN